MGNHMNFREKFIEKKLQPPDFEVQCDKCILRPLSENDVSQEYLNWLNDPEVNRFSRRRNEVLFLQDVLDYVNEANRSDKKLLMGIFVKKGLKHIGNVLLSEIDYYNGVCEISNLIGEKDYWGNGYAFDVDKYLIHHAFSKMKMRKILIGNISANRGATFLSSQLGFKLEGVLKEHVVFGQGYANVLRFGLVKDDFYIKVHYVV